MLHVQSARRKAARVALRAEGIIALLCAAACASRRAPIQEQQEAGISGAVSGSSGSTGGADGGGSSGSGGDGGPREGPNCTTITQPGPTIVDASGDTWTLQGPSTNLVVYRNGKLAGYSANVTRLLYVNHVVSQENAAGGWWDWATNNWDAEADPRVSCNSGADAGGPLEGGLTYMVGYGGGATESDVPTVEGWLGRPLDLITDSTTTGGFYRTGFVSANGKPTARIISVPMLSVQNEKPESQRHGIGRQR